MEFTVETLGTLKKAELVKIAKDLDIKAGGTAVSLRKRIAEAMEAPVESEPKNEKEADASTKAEKPAKASKEEIAAAKAAEKQANFEKIKAELEAYTKENSIESAEEYNQLKELAKKLKKQHNPLTGEGRKELNAIVSAYKVAKKLFKGIEFDLDKASYDTQENIVLVGKEKYDAAGYAIRFLANQWPEAFICLSDLPEKSLDNEVKASHEVARRVFAQDFDKYKHPSLETYDLDDDLRDNAGAVAERLLRMIQLNPVYDYRNEKKGGLFELSDATGIFTYLKLDTESVALLNEKKPGFLPEDYDPGSSSYSEFIPAYSLMNGKKAHIVVLTEHQEVQQIATFGEFVKDYAFMFEQPEAEAEQEDEPEAEQVEASA